MGGADMGVQGTLGRGDMGMGGDTGVGGKWGWGTWRDVGDGGGHGDTGDMWTGGTRRGHGNTEGGDTQTTGDVRATGTWVLGPHGGPIPSRPPPNLPVRAVEAAVAGGDCPCSSAVTP